ncbi:M16 family metallopeptidase [Pseudoteredinibacter isoporae]|uniref:M16 family metallopeptidase n=1 Tax=Pseudoteredinibacter isoporae TaxID=570281 RepID=UPI00310959E9
MGLSFRKTLIASAIIAASTLSQGILAKPVKVTEVEGISEYRLDNGLRVLLFPDVTQETVTVNVTYQVGSKHENYGETGMAHLLEHLVFKGSPKHKDIPKELSEHGARPNGTTWTDRTNYFETFNATEKNIDWALDMEADRMVNSFIAQKDLDSEMTVVRNEFERGENSPYNVLAKRVMASAYSWHNYGKSTIGARSDIENVSIDRLKAFYKKYYQPDNATLIVAGKFELKDMLKKVEAAFGPIPKPERVIEPLYTQEPAQDGEKLVTVRRVGDVQVYLMAYHVPAGSHEDFAALEVLSGIMSETPRGRLHQEVVEKKLATQSYGFNFQWAEPGLMMYGLVVDKAEDLNKAIDASHSVLENLAKTPITKKEVERTKRKLIKNFELGFNSSESVALELSEWLGMGDWRLLFLNRDRIETVSVEDVQRVAEKYLTRNNRTAGRYLPAETPERVEIPAVASVSDMLKDYKGRKAVSAGEVFDASFDNIDKRTDNFTIAKDLKVSLLPKKTRGESVEFYMSLNLGDEKSLMSKSNIGSATASLLMHGTSKYTREQLQDEFDKLKSSVSIGGGATGIGIRANTKRENLPKVIELVAHVLKEANFDSKEFDQYKAKTKVNLEQSMQNPQSLVFREYSRRHRQVSQDHPHYVPTFDESLTRLEALKLEDIKSFHELFYGSQFGEIAIVGDFDEKAIRKQLKTLFADWKPKTDYQRIERAYKAVDNKAQQFNTPDKENAVFAATISLPINDDHQDSPALVLGNYMLGGGFLNSRLATKLRQEDGLSYSAGSFLNQSELDNRSALGIYAICAPQNLAKVEAGVKEVLQKVIDSGFTEEEIASAKSGYLQQRKIARSKDDELAPALGNNAYLKRNMQWSKDFEAKIESLTAKDIHDVMKRYLGIKEFAILTGADFSKTK